MSEQPIPVSVYSDRRWDVEKFFRQQHPGKHPCWDCLWDYLSGVITDVERVSVATGFKFIGGMQTFLCTVHWDIRDADTGQQEEANNAR